MVSVKTSEGKRFTIDWNRWEPTREAVLTFIRMRGQILLINKLRGLGKGKINAPGGKIEPGETPLHAAVRETEEEVGVTPLHLHRNGILRFAFTDGYSMKCHVFTAPSFSGTVRESDEAIPFWCKESMIPYPRMWEDDRLWLPLVLKGKVVNDDFIFEGDTMLWHGFSTEIPDQA